MNTDFDDIRPYTDQEIPAAMQRIADSSMLPIWGNVSCQQASHQSEHFGVYLWGRGTASERQVLFVCQQSPRHYARRLASPERAGG